MTDTWDELIDAATKTARVVESDCNNVNVWKMNTARSALRDAIDAVVKDRDEWKDSNMRALEIADKYQARVAALEAQLAEADADAERLFPDSPYFEDNKGREYCQYCDKSIYEEHGDNCAWVLHVARLSKRGQG